MRSLVIALLVLVSACALGPGVDPESEPPVTTAAPVATIVVDEATRSAATSTAAAFYDAALGRDGRAIAALGIDPPETLQADLDAWAGPIGVVGGSFIVIRSTFTDTRALVTVRLTLDLIEVGPWSYETTVELVGGPDWQVLWDPSALHPALQPGDVLRVDRSWPPRAAIRAADGTPLASAEAVKIVGVVPNRVVDLETLKSDLARLAGIDPAVVERELSNPDVQPDWFVPVGTLKLVVYDAVADELDTVDGVLLRDGSERVPYQEGFATHLLGTVGPITADQLEALGFPYGPIDSVGQTGLEAEYESQLAGRPRTAVVRINRFGRIVEELLVLEGAEPETIDTTIDLEVQAAAERAVRDVRSPAAVVVLEASTGRVLGMVSRPAESDFDRAALGAYPPGSTFKVVTAAGLLAAGLDPSSEVECPSEVTIGGLTISNAGGADAGSISLTEALALSCNTTFAAAGAETLGASGLEEVAESFGFNSDYPDAGIEYAAGSFPFPQDTAEAAAASIGQGRVLASPLHMASVAAASATGTWRPPTVIARSTRQEGTTLDPGVIAGLRIMMRAVVADGTGTKASVPGVIVRGKTGSAEFGAGSTTHAWFIGYWDDFAIAVIVERGGAGGTVAAPLARRVVAELSG